MCNRLAVRSKKKYQNKSIQTVAVATVLQRQLSILQLSMYACASIHG